MSPSAGEQWQADPRALSARLANHEQGVQWKIPFQTWGWGWSKKTPCWSLPTPPSLTHMCLLSRSPANNNKENILPGLNNHILKTTWLFLLFSGLIHETRGAVTKTIVRRRWDWGTHNTSWLLCCLLSLIKHFPSWCQGLWFHKGRLYQCTWHIL